jgi:hypothetical protein
VCTAVGRQLLVTPGKFLYQLTCLPLTCSPSLSHLLPPPSHFSFLSAPSRCLAQLAISSTLSRTQGLSAHHPRPFFALFRQVDDWLRRYFTGVYQLIDAEDMRMFIDRSSNFGRTSNLRTLFYPVWPDDFNITMRVRVTGGPSPLECRQSEGCA